MYSDGQATCSPRPRLTKTEELIDIARSLEEARARGWEVSRQLDKS